MNFLEYIETDGYCWFDTGVIPDSNTIVETVITPIRKIGYYSYFFGSLNSDSSSVSSKRFYVRNDYTSLRRMNGARNDRATNNTVPNIALDTQYNILFSPDGLRLNDTLYSIGVVAEFTGDYPMYIGTANFAGKIHTDNNVPRAFAAKYGEFKVYDTSTDNLVADLKPAQDVVGNIGFYDTVSNTFHPKMGDGVATAGPYSGSIQLLANKTVLAATGATALINVMCENAWTAAGNTWLQLSATAGAGDATIIATAPPYTGATAREDTVTFTDSVTGEFIQLTVKQRKYSAGQPFYLGNNEVAEAYLGNTALTEAYLGEVLVYWAGEFAGIKLSPRTVEFDSFNSTSTIKVKASEAWTMTLPSWLSADTLTGSPGETVVTLTSSAAAQTGGTITVSGANYSDTAEAEYVAYEQLYSIYSAVTAGDAFVNLGLQSSNGFGFIWNGQILNNTVSTFIGSYNASDANDWRWFQVNSGGSGAFFDIGARRLMYQGAGLNEDVVFTCGNFYVKDGATIVASGSTINNVPALDIYYNKQGLKTRHLMFEDNGALVSYLLPVAKPGYNSYGFYDVIRKMFIEVPDTRVEYLPSYDLMDAQQARYLGDVYYWVDLGVDISATVEEPVFEEDTSAADGFATRQQNGTTWMFMGGSYFGEWLCSDIGITIQPIYFPDVQQPNGEPLMGLLVTDGQAGTDRFVPVTGLISWDAEL